MVNSVLLPNALLTGKLGVQRVIFPRAATCYNCLSFYLVPKLQLGNAYYQTTTSTPSINFLQQKNIKTILEQLAFYKKSHKNQTHYQLWQEGCHPEIISTVGMMRQKWVQKPSKIF
jgi:hypothetical protein